MLASLEKNNTSDLPVYSTFLRYLLTLASSHSPPEDSLVATPCPHQPSSLLKLSYTLAAQISFTCLDSTHLCYSSCPLLSLPKSPPYRGISHSYSPLIYSSSLPSDVNGDSKRSRSFTPSFLSIGNRMTRTGGVICYSNPFLPASFAPCQRHGKGWRVLSPVLSRKIALAFPLCSNNPHFRAKYPLYPLSLP